MGLGWGNFMGGPWFLDWMNPSLGQMLCSYDCKDIEGLAQEVYPLWYDPSLSINALS